LLEWSDLVWVRGGNAIDLAVKMQESKFADALVQSLKADLIVYGGYSAGACVLGSSLEGVEYADENIHKLTNEQLQSAALSLYRKVIIPHFNSEKNEIIKKWEQYCIENNMPFAGLADGEVVVISNGAEKLLK